MPTPRNATSCESRCHPEAERSEAEGCHGAAIDALREDSHRGKPLQLTLKGLYSWRTGDWRIVYRIERQRIEVVHATLGHRREVYDHLRSLLR